MAFQYLLFNGETVDETNASDDTLHLSPANVNCLLSELKIGNWAWLAETHKNSVQFIKIQNIGGRLVYGFPVPFEVIPQGACIQGVDSADMLARLSDGKVECEAGGIIFIRGKDGENSGGVGGEIKHKDSESIAIKGKGISGDELSGSVKVSGERDNSLSVKSDGLYVQKQSGGGSGGLERVEHSDTHSILFSGAGTVGDKLQAAVQVSPNAENILEATTQGLFVPKQGSGTGIDHIETQPSAGVEFLGDGTASKPLKASLRVSSVAGNIFEQRADGIYVPEGKGGGGEGVDQIARDAAAEAKTRADNAWSRSGQAEEMAHTAAAAAADAKSTADTAKNRADTAFDYAKQASQNADAADAKAQTAKEVAVIAKDTADSKLGETDLKTVNGNSLVGSGDIKIEGGDGDMKSVIYDPEDVKADAFRTENMKGGYLRLAEKQGRNYANSEQRNTASSSSSSSAFNSEAYNDTFYAQTALSSSTQSDEQATVLYIAQVMTNTGDKAAGVSVVGQIDKIDGINIVCGISATDKAVLSLGGKQISLQINGDEGQQGQVLTKDATKGVVWATPASGGGNRAATFWTEHGNIGTDSDITKLFIMGTPIDWKAEMMNGTLTMQLGRPFESYYYDAQRSPRSEKFLRFTGGESRYNAFATLHWSVLKFGQSPNNGCLSVGQLTPDSAQIYYEWCDDRIAVVTRSEKDGIISYIVRGNGEWKEW